jgi:hypothetical protein
VLNRLRNLQRAAAKPAEYLVGPGKSLAERDSYFEIFATDIGVESGLRAGPWPVQELGTWGNRYAGW